MELCFIAISFILTSYYTAKMILARGHAIVQDKDMKRSFGTLRRNIDGIKRQVLDLGDALDELLDRIDEVEGGGNLLRLYRIRYGLSQTQIAELLAVSQRSVSKWENDASTIPPWVIDLIVSDTLFSSAVFHKGEKE